MQPNERGGKSARRSVHVGASLILLFLVPQKHSMKLRQAPSLFYKSQWIIASILCLKVLLCWLDVMNVEQVSVGNSWRSKPAKGWPCLQKPGEVHTPRTGTELDSGGNTPSWRCHRWSTLAPSLRLKGREKQIKKRKKSSNKSIPTQLFAILLMAKQRCSFHEEWKYYNVYPNNYQGQ